MATALIEPSEVELRPALRRVRSGDSRGAAGGLASFARLAAGDRRMARALYRAELAAGTARATSLDEIAAMRPRGWSHVFRELKARGLVEEQTLGQVVARWARRPTLRALP